MSLSHILDPATGNESWKSVYVNDLSVEGTLSANIIATDGNITVANASPRIIISNNAVNTARATLEIRGRSGTIGRFQVQQDETGKGNIQNFQANANTDLTFTGTGKARLIGSSYPAGPYLLGLDASNQIVRSDTAFNFTINWTGPVTVSTNAVASMNGNVVTITFPTSTNNGSSVSANMVSQAGILPVALRTSAPIFFPIKITDNNVDQMGLLQITISGILGISHINGDPFSSNAALTGFAATGFSYVIF